MPYSYGVRSSDILDMNESGGEIAVRLAIGEAQIVEDNRNYFSSVGVDIAALESAHSNSKTSARSTTMLLVKNLPNDSSIGELEAMFSRFVKM